MLFTKTVTGTYGSNETPCFVFVANDNYMNYYVVEGGQTVNATHDSIEDGVNVEELNDVDCFTWNTPIETIEQLENAVNA